MPQPRIIAIASQKGGVAKTTSCINLGFELARTGHNVLMIDLDPQGHLAEQMGISAEGLERSMSGVLERKYKLADIIITMRDNLDMAPANIALATTEVKLFPEARREDRLKTALVPTQDNYDVILIDCPPSLGLLTVNALSAAQEVLIPMSTEYLSMLGVKLLLESVENMRAELNPDLKVIGILPTRNKRTKHAEDVLESVKKGLPDIRIFSTAIPDTVDVQNASAAGQSVREYKTSSAAAYAYAQAAKEL